MKKLVFTVLIVFTLFSSSLFAREDSKLLFGIGVEGSFFYDSYLQSGFSYNLLSTLRSGLYIDIGIEFNKVFWIGGEVGVYTYPFLIMDERSFVFDLTARGFAQLNIFILAIKPFVGIHTSNLGEGMYASYTFGAFVGLKFGDVFQILPMVEFVFGRYRFPRFGLAIQLSF